MGLSLSDQGSALIIFRLIKQSHHALAFTWVLTLTLLVSEVVADNHDATLATDNFALIANLLHAWLNFHDCPPSFTACLNVHRST